MGCWHREFYQGYQNCLTGLTDQVSGLIWLQNRSTNKPVETDGFPVQNGPIESVWFSFFFILMKIFSFLTSKDLSQKTPVSLFVGTTTWTIFYLCLQHGAATTPLLRLLCLTSVLRFLNFWVFSSQLNISLLLLCAFLFSQCQSTTRIASHKSWNFTFQFSLPLVSFLSRSFGTCWFLVYVLTLDTY